MEERTTAQDLDGRGAQGGAPRLKDETVRHYLETIFYISHEGETVRPGRIAEWLGVSAPTVSTTLKSLERDGWIQLASDRSVTTTEKGEAMAAQTVRVHRLAERWLRDVLDLDMAAADEEAQRISGGISDEVADRLDEALGQPSTCPHGNIIPGRQAPYGELVALDSLASGEKAVVRRISEVAEHEAPNLLRQLESCGIVPGVTLEMGSDDSGLGAIPVTIKDKSLALGAEVARSIWVELV